MSDVDVAQLLARLEALEARAGALPVIDPGWGIRTCQVCGKPAVVIDADDAKRRDGSVPSNGEGYCKEHAPDELFTDGYTRLDRPKGK